MKKMIFISLFLFQASYLLAQRTENFNFHIYLQSKLKHPVEEWDVSKLKKDTSALLIDVRSKEEFDVSHLKNSMNFPQKKFKTEQISHISKDKRIVIYCSVGYRSEKVAEKLKKAGYKNTVNLYGGIFEWVNRGFPIYDSEQKLTKKVHAYSHAWGVWLEKGEKVYE
jgi:rhodanese-related sulfurtransferase